MHSGSISTSTTSNAQQITSKEGSAFPKFISLKDEHSKKDPNQPIIKRPTTGFSLEIENYTWHASVTYQALQHFEGLMIQIYCNEKYRILAEDQFKITFYNPTLPENFEAILSNLHLEYKHTHALRHVFLVFCDSLSYLKNLFLYLNSTGYIKSDFYFELHKCLDAAKTDEKIQAAKFKIRSTLYETSGFKREKNHEEKKTEHPSNSGIKASDLAITTISTTASVTSSLCSMSLSSSSSSTTPASAALIPSSKYELHHAQALTLNLLQSTLTGSAISASTQQPQSPLKQATTGEPTPQITNLTTLGKFSSAAPISTHSQTTYDQLPLSSIVPLLPLRK